MKDAFFRWWDCLSAWMYKLVLKVTYFVLTKRKCRGNAPLSRENKEKIQSYWKKAYGENIPTYEYGWYQNKGVTPDPRIIPDMVWHSVVEPYFNNVIMEKGFCDKNYFETIIGKKNSPETLFRCINLQLLDGTYKAVGTEQLCEALSCENEVICKPSIDSGGGRSIVFLSREEISSEKITELIKKYSGNFIVQRIVKQHDFLNQFNSKSLNTMRILSFLYKGNVHILSGFLRIGGEESRLDNVSSGGYYIQINREGCLDSCAVREDIMTHDLIKCESLPGGINFAGQQVPCWNEIVQLITESHFKLAHFQIINWDIAINYDGTPLVIEYNLIDSSPSFHQLNIGPVFGDMTDMVLQELATNRKIKT